jgi:hypothetical protein
MEVQRPDSVELSDPVPPLLLKTVENLIMSRQIKDKRQADRQLVGQSVIV